MLFSVGCITGPDRQNINLLICSGRHRLVPQVIHNPWPWLSPATQLVSLVQTWGVSSTTMSILCSCNTCTCHELHVNISADCSAAASSHLYRGHLRKGLLNPLADDAIRSGSASEQNGSMSLSSDASEGYSNMVVASSLNWILSWNIKKCKSIGHQDNAWIRIDFNLNNSIFTKIIY